MKRGKPLSRRSRLRTKRGLVRKTPLRQESAKRAAASGRPRRPADTGPDRTTRELVLERDDYRCVRCGEPVFGTPCRPFSLHHRRNRGAGGSSDAAINAPSNLILVCGDGVRHCHGALGANPAAAVAAGYSVSLNSAISPADVPVLHAVHGLVFLLPDGTWTPALNPEGSSR